MLLRQQRRGRFLPLLLTLFMLLTIAQFGLGATSASAGDVQNCPPFAVRKQSYPNATYDIEERCIEVVSWDGSRRVWFWEVSDVKPKRTDRKTTWVGGKSSPPYTMNLQALISDSRPGGAGFGRVNIAQPNGGNLDRRIAVHVVIQVSTAQGWATCSDAGWREAAAERSMMQWAIDQATVPDCGTGSYRTAVWGRFFSTSLNRWETRGPIVTPALSLPPT